MYRNAVLEMLASISAGVQGRSQNPENAEVPVPSKVVRIGDD